MFAGSRRHSSRRSAVVLGATFLACAPAFSEPAPERTELRRADLGGAADTEVIMSELKLHPGARVPRHMHHGEEYLYVITGGTVETASNETMELEPGTTLHFERGEVHGGFTATGPSTLKAITVHIVDKGKPLYVEAQ